MNLFRELEAAEEIIRKHQEEITKLFGSDGWELNDVSFSTARISLYFIMPNGSLIMQGITWTEFGEKLPRVYAKLLVATLLTVA